MALILLLVPFLLPAGCAKNRQEPQRSHDWRAVAPAPVEKPVISPPPAAAPEGAPPAGAQTWADPAAAPPAGEVRPLSAPRVSWPEEAPRGADGELVRAGRELADETPRRLKGEGNLLSCSSCHRQGGSRDGSLSWLGVAPTYPRYVPLAGRSLSLAEQVNFCLERGLNASPLPRESPEMQTILAYLEFLGRYPASSPLPFEPPDRRADLESGEAGYHRACAGCHGPGGEGSVAEAQPQAPPLWGEGSYGAGSGLHRLLTAAAFLRDQMPPATSGRPALPPAEAYDIAAYVNSFERPQPPGLENDYPALSEKPADCPSPPYPDRFPADQHKYGPFPPIEAEAAAAAAADWRRFHWDVAGLRAAAARIAAGGK